MRDYAQALLDAFAEDGPFARLTLREQKEHINAVLAYLQMWGWRPAERAAPPQEEGTG